MLAMLAAGCAQMSQVSAGDVTVRQRLVIKVDSPWNQFERIAGDTTPTWTQEGITVDTLRFHVALKDGELIAPTPSEPKGQMPLAFKSSMQPSEVISLFEAYYSRDGSTFKLDRVVPATFVGQQGFQFEFSSVRKTDEVQLRGIGWGAVRNGELFVITYTAPRLAFFQRGVGGATAIAKSARVSS
ncbi:MAG TPA: hypothetical protein VI032_01225 [Burkholderiaceae bacterium]